MFNKFNQILSETNIDLDRTCLGLLLVSCQVRACLLVKLLWLFFKYPLFKKSQIISNFYTSFQNEPVPLGAMLTKGAVRDNLPPVARALALHEFKMTSHVKTRSNRSCYKYSLLLWRTSNLSLRPLVHRPSALRNNISGSSRSNPFMILKPSDDNLRASNLSPYGRCFRRGINLVARLCIFSICNLSIRCRGI